MTSRAPRSRGGPLAGRRILVTRGGAGGESLANGLREYGATARALALIEPARPRDPEPLARAAERWNEGAYDWLVLTSANGVAAFVEAGGRPASRCTPPSPDTPLAPRPRIAAVGPATERALRRAGFDVHLVPKHDYSGEGLGRTLAAALDSRSRLLLPVSEIADDAVETAVRQGGHAVDRVTAYRTVPAVLPGETEAEIDHDLARGAYDAVIIMSGSAARELHRRFGAAIARTRGAAEPGGQRPMIAAIGPPTASALAACGVAADLVAAVHTSQGLIDALARHFEGTTP